MLVDHSSKSESLDRLVPRLIPCRPLGPDEVLAVGAPDDPDKPPCPVVGRDVADRPAGPMEAGEGAVEGLGFVRRVEAVHGAMLARMVVDGGFKVTVEHRKGIDPAALVVALEQATAKARAEVEAAEQGGETAAA